jgi:hypothetical protein
MEGEREREWRGIDGSPGLREKCEREGENERDERNGGEIKPTRVSAVLQKFNFFLGGGGADVEDATSTRDGRWADGRWMLRIS